MPSTTQKLIVVVGATGAQGGSVLNTFLAIPGYRIRALTRGPTTAKAQALASKSCQIEVASADLSDPVSLSRAFENATSIFAVTDWMAIYQSPSFFSQTPPPGQTLNQYACTIETQQAQTVFDAASKIVTLERLVFSTLAHVSKWSHGKYRHGYHFDSKALAVQLLQPSYPDLWKKTSLIQMGACLENFIHFPLFQPQKDVETGEIVFETLGSNEGPRAALPYVTVVEDTGPIVQALIDQLPAEKHVFAHRELMSLEEVASIFEKVTGKKAQARYGKKMDGMPEDLKLQFEDTFAFATEFGYWGADESVVMPKDLGIDLNLGTAEEWFRKQDWSTVLGP